MQLFVELEAAGPHPAREHDDVRVGELGEGAVGDDADHLVVAPDLAPLIGDEGDVDGRYALEDLVGADPVQCGEPRKQGNDGLEMVGHALAFRSVTTRKRRR